MTARDCWLIGCLVGVASTAAAAPAVHVHREGVRFDLSSGGAIGGTPEELAPLPAPVALRAARDEVVAVQLVVSGEAGSWPLHIEASAGLEVTAFAELGVRSGGHHYPDALVPTSSVVVPTGPAIAALWIDVWATPTGPVGPGTVTIRIGEATPVVLAVEVLAVALGPLPGFGARLGGAPWSEAKTRAWAQVLHAHGVDLEVEPRDDATRALVSGALFTAGADYRGPRTGIPPARALLPMTSVAREDVNAWVQAIEAFVVGTATVPAWVVSAPPIVVAADVERTRAWGERLAALPAATRARLLLRASDAFGLGLDGLSDGKIAHVLGPVVDEWVVPGSLGRSPWNVLEARREEDRREKILFRSGPEAGPPATPLLSLDVELGNARAWGWIVHAYHLDGALVEGLDALGDCRSDPPCGGSRPLESALVWRGEDLGLAADRPIASMRLKALRRGAQDAALLGLLDARDADTGRALADIMVPMAMGDEQPEKAGPSWPQGALAYDRARGQILDRLAGTGPTTIASIRPEFPADPVRRYGGWPVVVGGAVILLLAIAWGASRASRT